MGGDGPRHAAVLGHPVEHSLSPVLHRAAYSALGLRGWTYERVDCPEERLPAVVSAAPGDHVGYSVTMPGKFAALEYAAAHGTVSERARTVGSANTLVRRGDGWFADCTDVDGVAGALGGFTGLPGAGRAVVVGVGGTSRPVLAGLAAAGFGHVTLVSRRDNAGPARECGRAFGLDCDALLLDDPALPDRVRACDVLVSTVPSSGADVVLPLAPLAPRVFDVLYDPWPTGVAAAARRAGAQVVGGDTMLLHQAFGQVELFTGCPAPREAMAAALGAALGR